MYRAVCSEVNAVSMHLITSFKPLGSPARGFYHCKQTGFGDYWRLSDEIYLYVGLLSGSKQSLPISLIKIIFKVSHGK